MRKGRRNRPQKAGERANREATAACRYRSARLKKPTKTTAYSSAPAWLPRGHGGLCSSLSENAVRIPPVRSWIPPRFRCVFRSASPGRKCRAPPLSRYSPSLVAVARRLVQGTPGSGVGGGEWRSPPLAISLGLRSPPSPPATSPRPDPTPGSPSRKGGGLRELSGWARGAREDEAGLGKCLAGRGGRVSGPASPR